MNGSVPSQADIDPAAAVGFLRLAFEPDDWLAVFLKRHRTGRVAQRVAPASVMAATQVQDWVIRENRRQANVYVSVNALLAQTTLRRRSVVGAIRHVFLDVDANLDAVLATIAARRDLPTVSYVLRTSDRHGHVFWRANGFTGVDVEALEKHLARELQADPAATACSQLTRLPGYLNHKHTPACPVTVEYSESEVRYTPVDFPKPCVHVLRAIRTDREHELETSVGVLERARQYLAAVPPAISGAGLRAKRSRSARPARRLEPAMPATMV